MKKNKRKSLVKTARKSAQKNILESLIVELKKVSANIGAGSSRLEKVIEKGSMKLAKKVVKELKLEEFAPAETSQPAKAEDAKPANPQKAESVAPVSEKSQSKKGTKKKTKEAVAVTAS